MFMPPMILSCNVLCPRIHPFGFGQGQAPCVILKDSGEKLVLLTHIYLKDFTQFLRRIAQRQKVRRNLNDSYEPNFPFAGNSLCFSRTFLLMAPEIMNAGSFPKTSSGSSKP
jgi:hypothetical protein